MVERSVGAMRGGRAGVMLRIVAVVAVMTSAWATMGATWSPEALEAVRRMPVQHNGRVKPFDTFARETLDRLTGAPRWRGEDPVVTLVSMLASPERWMEAPLVAVPFHPLRERLGMPPKSSHISYGELIATKQLMQMLPPIVEKQQRDEKLSMLENEAMDVYDRFVTLGAIWQHDLKLVPPPPGGGAVWRSIANPEGYAPDAQESLRQAWGTWIGVVRQEGDAAWTASSWEQLSEALRAANPDVYPPDWRLRLELLYNRSEPFRVARWLYLFAALGFLAAITTGRRGAAGLAITATLVAFLIHGNGIVARVVIGGRPPVSNFYETMLWLPFVAVLVALVFEKIYRVRFFGLAAALLASIVLLLADHLPLEPSISPVVAVLRSNLWLTIHVLTIVASYGALALATMLAHIYGWLYFREAHLVKREASQEVSGSRIANDERRTTLHDLGTWLYRTIQVGVVLLAAGIMLGAVWANASWGRYWGWDPKETWALITLLWFLALLHGRFAGWVKDAGLAIGTIGGFFLLLMTYYGVSFYLVGLHSYAGGNAKPIPPLLIAYLVGEVVVMAAVGLKAFSSRRPS